MSIFSIRTTKENIALSSQGEGHLAFSVHNTSTKAILPAKAQIETDLPEAETWISFVNGDEKDFAIGATQQFQVRIQVPDDARADKYSFRLSMIGVESPDEHFTQGPSVSFVVPEKKVAPAVRKLPWLWIGLGGFLFAGVAGFLGWELIKEPPVNKIAIENYVGQPLTSIVEDLRTKGFEVTAQAEENAQYGKGIIISQRPIAGHYEKGSIVTLQYSNNDKYFQLERYLGLSIGEAKNKLIIAGFNSNLITIERRTNRYAKKNTVIVQSPLPGVIYSVNKEINLVVSEGKPVSTAGVVFQNPISFRGTGCPNSGSVKVTGSNTPTLAVKFRQHDVGKRAESNRSIQSSCNFTIPIKVPNGLQISHVVVDWEGYVQGKASLRRKFYLFSNHPWKQKKFNNPTGGQFTVRDRLHHASFSSHCNGGLYNMKINSRVRAMNRDSYIAIDTTDLNNRVTFKVNFRNC